MRLLRLFKSDLAQESAEWVSDGLISESQARAICARYGAEFDQAKRRSLGYLVLLGLGYLFIGLAVIVLLGANWDAIPRALRLSGLVALTLATHGLGLGKFLRHQAAAAGGLFFLGNLFYGAAIILVAQIYHLGEHMPDGVLWWALGTLPFGLLLRHSWLALQTLTLALIWFGLESSLGFYPVAMPLFWLSALYVLYRGPRSVLLFLLTVFSIGWWVEYSLAYLWGDSAWHLLEAELAIVSCALLILGYALSLWLAARGSALAGDYAAVLALWSLRFVLLLLLYMSFEQPWQALLAADWRYVGSMLGVVGALSALALWLGKLAGHTLRISLLLAAALAILAVILLARGSALAVLLQVLDNLALIGLGIYLVFTGIRQGISHYFFLGVTALGVTALLRYVDLIGDYIGGAALFLLFALLLLGAARYWKWLQQQESAQ